jgi:hypothetical protein
MAQVMLRSRIRKRVKAFVHKADGKHGGFVRLLPTAANRTHDTRLGTADWVAIIALVVLLAGAGVVLRMVLAW